MAEQAIEATAPEGATPEVTAPEGVVPTVDTAAVDTAAVKPTRFFDIVGFDASGAMPISFNGLTYDLANLSDEQANYLLGFPDQVPHIRVVASLATTN